MASMNLLTELDAERINGGFGYGYGKPSYHPKSSYSSTTYKSAQTFLAQGNVSSNLALGIGFHGLGVATATNVQENVAFVNTIA